MGLQCDLSIGIKVQDLIALEYGTVFHPLTDSHLRLGGISELSRPLLATFVKRFNSLEHGPYFIHHFVGKSIDGIGHGRRKLERI